MRRPPISTLFPYTTLFRSGDGTIALSVYEPSPNGNYLGYGVSTGGSDWQEFRVRDVRTARDLPDTIRWVKFSDRKSTRLNSSHGYISYAVFCLKKKRARTQ